jgi:hypothetical protein
MLGTITVLMYKFFAAVEIYNLGKLLYGVEGETPKLKILMVDARVLNNVIPVQ